MKNLLFGLLLLSLTASAQSHPYMIAGTYTKGSSKGIYVYDFNPTNGTAALLDSAVTSNPSYLAVSPNQQFVYAVNENVHNGSGGSVTAYSFNKKTGHLTMLNEVRSAGDAPCYISVDKTGRWILVGNYVSGTLAVISVNKDGSLNHLVDSIHHSGNGVNKMRQEGPHVHCTYITPDNKYVLVPDLGIDKVVIYSFDDKTGRLKPAAQPFVKLSDGAGPRHIVIHPNGKWAYLAQELKSFVTVFNYHNGSLKAIETTSTVPKDYKGPLTTADVHVSLDGKYLYVSNRDNSNTIAIFKINGETGKLTSIGYQSTLGNAPRNFNFDPSGNYLLVANQNSNNIVIYKVNHQTGMLQPENGQIKVGNPVCIKWITR
jgi:3-carboxymuconate cyclase